MKKWIESTKQTDWSLNLEDPYYAEHEAEMLEEAVIAIGQTAEGHYVNIVTPGEYGDPRGELIPSLERELEQREVKYREIRYVDECGCGGHVTRIYR